MDDGRSVHFETMCVKSCPIALVLIETIVRILLGIFSHRAVTRHFGDDGCGLDFFDETISSDDIFDRFRIDATESVIVPSIDLDFCDTIRTIKYLFHCLFHCESIRLADTDTVDDG